MPAAGTIDEVIAGLSSIIAEARRKRSRLGYFAALYRLVTQAVQRGIAAGRFQDGARMERLDVAFANRYLEAYDAFAAGRPVSASWRLAFDAALSDGRIILQHLLLGMNAHINLDLAVSAADTAPGTAIAGLESDFSAINDILNEQIEGVQNAIATASPAMYLLDWVGGRNEECLVAFSLKTAREQAWRHAQRLAALPEDARVHAIGSLDLATALVGAAVAHPPGFLRRGALWWVARQEEPDAARIIDALAAVAPLR